jgi:hypothetical protein
MMPTSARPMLKGKPNRLGEKSIRKHLLFPRLNTVKTARHCFQEQRYPPSAARRMLRHEQTFSVPHHKPGL